MVPTWLRRTLIGLELFLSVGAFYGAWHLVTDPSGGSLQMPASQFLPGTPFDTFLVPGLILFAANGIFPLVVVVGALMKQPWARYGHVAVGALLTGWMLVQGALVGFGAAIQVFYLAYGLVLLALALTAWNAERPGHGHGGPLLHT